MKVRQLNEERKKRLSEEVMTRLNSSKYGLLAVHPPSQAFYEIIEITEATATITNGKVSVTFSHEQFNHSYRIEQGVFAPSKLTGYNTQLQCWKDSSGNYRATRMSPTYIPSVIRAQSIPS